MWALAAMRTHTWRRATHEGQPLHEFMDPSYLINKVLQEWQWDEAPDGSFITAESARMVSWIPWLMVPRPSGKWLSALGWYPHGGRKTEWQERRLPYRTYTIGNRSRLPIKHG